MNFAQMLMQKVHIRKPVSGETRTCRRCLQAKPLDEFNFYTHKVNGRRYPRCYCKTCSTIYNRERRRAKRKDCA